MPAIPLPQDPDLGQLRKQARELQRAVRVGDQAALALVAEFHPDPADQETLVSAAATGTFPLSAAQLVIARRYGFARWPRLHRHVVVVTARCWTPGAPPAGEAPLADRFLRLACLTYSADDRSDRIAAARLLADHPELPALSLPVAAACCDVPQVRRFLAADPAQA